MTIIRILLFCLFNIAINSIVLSQSKDSIIDVRDGQLYHTIKIGNQIWLSQNMNYKADSGSWCYMEIEENCSSNGRLYNWYTAQNVCPEGWHLPADDEWDTLTNYINKVKGVGIKGSDGDWSSLGYFLKSKTFWKEKGSGNDALGFNALPSGLRDIDGVYSDAGEIGNFWTATETAPRFAFCRTMYYYFSNINRNRENKSYGFSVRCVKNK